MDATKTTKEPTMTTTEPLFVTYFDDDGIEYTLEAGSLAELADELTAAGYSGGSLRATRGEWLAGWVSAGQWRAQ